MNYRDLLNKYSRFELIESAKCILALGCERSQLDIDVRNLDPSIIDDYYYLRDILEAEGLGLDEYLVLIVRAKDLVLSRRPRRR